VDGTNKYAHVFAHLFPCTCPNVCVYVMQLLGGGVLACARMQTCRCKLVFVCVCKCMCACMRAVCMCKCMCVCELVCVCVCAQAHVRWYISQPCSTPRPAKADHIFVRVRTALMVSPELMLKQTTFLCGCALRSWSRLISCLSRPYFCTSAHCAHGLTCAHAQVDHIFLRVRTLPMTSPALMHTPPWQSSTRQTSPVTYTLYTSREGYTNKTCERSFTPTTMCLL
jgi:hypothetical protein